MRHAAIAGLTLALAAPGFPSATAEPVNPILNWTPTADHSPCYYTKAQGWYAPPTAERAGNESAP